MPLYSLEPSSFSKRMPFLSLAIHVSNISGQAKGWGITGYKSMSPIRILSSMSDHRTQRSSVTMWPPSLLAVLMTMQLVSSLHRRLQDQAIVYLHVPFFSCRVVVYS